MALARLCSLARTVTVEGRCLDRLAVQHRRCGSARDSRPPDKHQHHVIDRAERQSAHEAAEPPLDYLPTRFGGFSRYRGKISHSAFVRSVKWRFARYSRFAIRPRLARIHILSLHHIRCGHSKHYQMGSYCLAMRTNLFGALCSKAKA